MKQIFFFPIAVLLFLCTYIFPQNPEWIVFNTSNSGLPSDGITCLAIDSAGNKWIGTNEGLVKYDGFNWVIYDTTNSDLQSNNITCLAIDKDDNIWIGFVPIYNVPNNSYEGSGGLAKFDGDSWTIYDTTNSDIPCNHIREIAIDNHGNKWLGRVWDRNKIYGLVKYDDTNWTVYDTLNSGLPSNNVWCIEIDKYNNKWIGTCLISWGVWAGAGLVKFNDTTWTLYNKDNSKLPSNSIVDIEFDKKGCMWILSGEETGLAKFDGESWYFFEETIEQHDDYWCLTIDLEANKWIGMNAYTGPTDYGILKYNGNEWVGMGVDNSGIPSENVSCIKIDKYNNKWIGTRDGEYTGGLAIYKEDGVVTDINTRDIVIGEIPQYFHLHQNFPNPFNPSTTIKYTIPKQSNVTVKVFDVLGSEVITLVKKEQAQGNYAVEFDASELTSGIYLYSLQTATFAETKKMIMLK